MILGDGDDVPDEPEPTPNDDDDVEENLLRPPGVTLESVDMVVQVRSLASFPPPSRVPLPGPRHTPSLMLSSAQAFRGDDMPPMDPDFRTGIRLLDKATRQHNKALCDPYLVVRLPAPVVGRTCSLLSPRALARSCQLLPDPDALVLLQVAFAGRKAKTHHINDTYSPEWMEALHVAASIPSMADRLQLQVRPGEQGS